MGKLPPPSDLFPPEHTLFAQGYHFVAGIDEVGRGPLAGPVVAAAVILPSDHSLQGPLDSKKLSSALREKFFKIIQDQSLAFSFGIVDQWEIDRINIHHASLKAMEIAVQHLAHPVEYLLIDGRHPIRGSIPQKTIVKGDFMSTVIGAASVLAKVIRDRIMEEYHYMYPQYNFKKNKGYGTREHLQALRKHGCCTLHRKSFRGVIPVRALF